MECCDNNELFSSLENFEALSDLEQSYIDGGALVTVTIGSVVVKVTAAKAAGLIAGSYGLGYAIGKGWAHIVE